MTTTNDPLVGTTYDGRYRVERRIGTGGMANVYLAEDETLGRRVAIKVLHQRYAEDGQFIERFLREASAAARLNHPNIVQVYDRGQEGGTYYIAMEYVDGMTLKDLIQRRGALSEQEVLAYGRQALHALRFAHRNGIVHRDIKPHNMMVDTDGRLKIADFGIARAGADTGLTEAGSIVGTAQYLSPEQARGDDVGAPSDLYALGVVMFEMATGRVPFDGDSPVNVALRHVNDPVPRPSHLNGSVSPQIESIVLHAMEKDPAGRYASADEMLADLDRARSGETTSVMAQVGGTTAGSSHDAGATDVLGRTAVTPMRPDPASSVYQRPVPPEPAWPDMDDDDDDERSPRGRRAMLVVIGFLGLVALIGLLAWGLLARDTTEPVPNVVGAKLAAAEATIEREGFAVGDVTRRADDEAPEGVVVEQSPADEAEPGSDIDLVVSSGPELVEVPDVVGDAVAPARAELEEAGFVVRQQKIADEEVEPGFVVRQNPAGGGEVEPGSAVTIFVSSGPDEIELPSLVGMSFEEAKAKLEELELTVAEPRTEASSRPGGEVIAQDPAAGSVAADTEVVLTTASGENTVPDVVGESAEGAQAQIEGAGFQYSVVDEIEDPSLDPTSGPVVSSQSGAGESREVGSVVEVTIARPAPVEPDPEPTPEEDVPENGEDGVVDPPADDAPEVPADEQPPG